MNKKRTDHRFENLVFLCFDHHDSFDSTTSQSKNYTAGEISQYKSQLSEKLRSVTPADASSTQSRLGKTDKECMSQPWVHCAPWAGSPVLFPYKSPNLCDGVCRIEKIDLDDGRVLIICEQVEGNPGMSVTNAVEFIAYQACREYEIRPENLVWIEHYDPNIFDEDVWDLVEFGELSREGLFREPSWRQMTEFDWQSLGLKLSPETNSRIRESYSRVSRLIDEF
ncbi:MAG: hypothetical protein ACXWC4_09430 [Telluria sp.]